MGATHSPRPHWEERAGEAGIVSQVTEPGGHPQLQGLWAGVRACPVGGLPPPRGPEASRGLPGGGLWTPEPLQTRRYCHVGRSPGCLPAPCTARSSAGVCPWCGLTRGPPPLDFPSLRGRDGWAWRGWRWARQERLPARWASRPLRCGAFGAALLSRRRWLRALQPCRAVSCSLTSLDLRPLGGGPGVSTWGSPGWASAPLVDGACAQVGLPRGRRPLRSGSQVGREVRYWLWQRVWVLGS